MNSESQYREEAAETSPKPSAVRRSGNMAYSRKSRIGRPGLNPPATGRLVVNPQTEQHQPLRSRYPLKPRISSPENLPKVQPNDENEAAGQANDAEVRDGTVKDKTHEKPVIEEKEMDTPDAPQTILDDKLFGYQDNVASANVVEEDATSDFMSTFDAIQDDGEEQAEINDKKSNDRDRDIAAVPSVSNEPLSMIPIVHLRHPSQNEARARVYHRPHTNQTVVAGSNNNDDDDTKSTASGLSQPSWVSQTSVGNTKRRARLANGKKRDVRSRRGKYSSDDSRESITMGRVVSQAFDKMLGYAGGRLHEHEDGYSSDEESEGIINDLQEALLSTFGCSGPHPVNTRKTNNDDDLTIESNVTGGQSRQSHQSPRHVRNISNMSGSILSTISGSAMGSVLTFDTTEELADFRKEKNINKKKNATNKTQDNEDANPPKLQAQKTAEESEESSSVASNLKMPIYSEDAVASNSKQAVYSEDVLLNVKETDSEPFDLLAEGDSMLDSMGKDLLNVANTKVDAMFTSIGTLLGAKPLYHLDETDNDTKTDENTENMTLESGSVMNSLSNVTEPLEVITENDGELSPVRVKLTDKMTRNAFEDRYEICVFETIESVEGTEVVETTQTIRSVEGTEGIESSQEIKETESAASLFQGIDDQENQSPVESQEDPQDPPQYEDTKVEAKQEGLDENTMKVDNMDWNALLDFPETKAPGTRGQKDPSPSEISEKTIKEEELIKEPIKEDATTASPPSKDASKDIVPEIPTSPVAKSTEMKKEDVEDTTALIATEAKKPRKFTGIKKLIRRSFKKKKKTKNSSDIPLSSTLEETSGRGETMALSLPPGGTSTTQSPQVSHSSVSVSPELANNNSPEVTRPEDKPVDVKEGVTKDQPDAPTKNSLVDLGDDDTATNIAPLSCPTTPVREPEVVLDTPKTSNLGLEERKLTRPVSGTNLADLPGIDEAKSFREDPPARKVEVANKEDAPTAQPDPQSKDRRSNIINSGSIKSNDGFDLSLTPDYAFEKTKRISVEIKTNNCKVSANSFLDVAEVSFDEFHLDYDLAAERSWEAFGQSPDDLGAAAYRQKALEDAKKGSPQKVSEFPGMAEF